MKKVFFPAVAFLLLPLGLALADGNTAGADAPSTGQATALPAIASWAVNYGAGAYSTGFSGGSPVSSFSYGLSVDVTLPFLLPKSEWFALSAKAAYWYSPSLALAGFGATFYITPWFSLTTDFLAGYFYWKSDNSSTSQSGFAWTISEEADFTLQLGTVTPYLGLRAAWYTLAGPRGINVYAVVGDHMALGSGPTTEEARQKAGSALPQALLESAANEISLGEEVSYWSVVFSPAFGVSLFELYDTSRQTLPLYRANLHTAITFNMPFWPTAFVMMEYGMPIFSADYRMFFGLELGLSWRLLPRLAVSVRAGPIYNMNLFESKSDPWTRSIGGLAGIGLSFYLVPALSLGADVSFDIDQTRYGELNAGLSLTYHFLEKGKKAPQKANQTQPGAEKPQPLQGTPAADNQSPAAAAPQSGKGLAIKDVSIAGIFPVFHTFYDDHPIGKLTITNTGSEPISDITVSLIIRQYMDAPKECANLPELKAGEEKSVDIYALFKNTILDITQATKVAAEMTVSGTLAGKSTSVTKVETIRIYDRNAMTWDDDRKAAAFVTPKDPAVLVFSNNVNALLKGKMNRAIDKNLQTAIALHDALRLYGISYVSNPLTPYAVTSKDKSVVDTLKFPRQTFEYKAGDCSDLSILYSALMESVQVETAFITIPGHIFMAFALRASPEEIRRSFSQTDQLIFLYEKVWVPVEVTERDKTFMDAWQEGATEWRDNLSKGQSAFYPIHDAWGVYEPVGLPGSGIQPSLPDANRLVNDFRGDVTTLVDREIYNKVAGLQATITKSNQSPSSVNALGVLYARYDLVDKAEREFKRAIAKTEYPQALVNLGNLAYLGGDMNTAITYYNRAYKKDPKNAGALLGIARANQAIENYATAKNAYNELKAVDANLAGRFAYLELRGEESTRAAEISEVKDTVVWQE